MSEEKNFLRMVFFSMVLILISVVPALSRRTVSETIWKLEERSAWQQVTSAGFCQANGEIELRV